MRERISRFIETRYQAIFWPLLATFLTFGASFTIIGALLPRLLASLHWSYTDAGIVLAAGALGATLANSLSGMLIQRMAPKPVLVLGLLLLAVSLWFFGSSPSVLYNFVLYLLIGAGQGTIEVVENSTLVRMERQGQSHLMSFSHAAFSVGAIGGPAMTAVILARGLAWQTVYRLAAGVALAVAVIAALLPFNRLRRVAPEQPHEGRLRTLARFPMLILAFFFLFVYVGLETGISSWVSEYYVTIFSTPVATGAFMVSVFWFGIFTGRILLPILYRGPRQAESLLALAILYTGSLFCALVMPGPISAGIFFYLTSLGCSAIYPLVMTLLGRYFEKGQSVAVGFAASGGGIGSFAFPLVMASVAERFGLRAGFAVYLVMGVALTILAYFIVLQIKARNFA